jgi:hypothetical protein
VCSFRLSETLWRDCGYFFWLAICSPTAL